jgi:hypothetical protein
MTLPKGLDLKRDRNQELWTPGPVEVVKRIIEMSSVAFPALSF